MPKAILSLPASDIREIAFALRNWRLSSPYSKQAIDRLFRCSNSAGVAIDLQELADAGMSPSAMAITIELAASALEMRPAIDDILELVTTRPDTPVTGRDTSVVVREMFRSATKSVIIAGYAVYQGKKIFQALAERMDTTLDTT